MISSDNRSTKDASTPIVRNSFSNAVIPQTVENGFFSSDISLALQSSEYSRIASERISKRRIQAIVEQHNRRKSLQDR